LGHQLWRCTAGTTKARETLSTLRRSISTPLLPPVLRRLGPTPPKREGRARDSAIRASARGGAYLAEQDAKELVHCIRLNLDCSDAQTRRAASSPATRGPMSACPRSDPSSSSLHSGRVPRPTLRPGRPRTRRPDARVSAPAATGSRASEKLHSAWSELWSVGTHASAAWDANAARLEDRRSALLTRARGPRCVRVWRRPGVASPRRAADRRGTRCAPRVPRHGRARLSSLHTPVATSPDAGDGPPGPVSHRTTPVPVLSATRCRRSSSR
jgi:hypothetical protein